MESSEIDLIIARAMQEYRERHPEQIEEIPLNTPINEPATSEITQLEEVPVWDGHGETPENPLIRENSGSVLVSERTSRFSSAEWYEAIQRTNVVLAGLGGIGSWVAFLLARMQINNLILFDPDNVEEANLSGQMFSRADIGNSKVYAVRNILGSYSSFYPSAYDMRYPRGNASDIMICGFDNMAARREFYEDWKAHIISSSDPSKCLFIDGRLAAESFQVLCIRGDDTFNMTKYERDFLFSDEEAEQTICSYKQTTFMANMIGSVMVNLFVNFVANAFCEPLIPRDLPFFTEYSAETMYFKVVA